MGAQEDVPNISTYPFSPCPSPSALSLLLQESMGSWVQLLEAIGGGPLSQILPRKKGPVAGWRTQNQQERRAQSRLPLYPPPRLQPLLIGCFDKNSSHRENGIFIGHS